jgi:hypothetical protein
MIAMREMYRFHFLRHERIQSQEISELQTAIRSKLFGSDIIQKLDKIEALLRDLTKNRL